MSEVYSGGLGIKITVDDHSPEVLAALQNAINRGLDAIGATAEGYAKDVITEADRVDTGRMRASITHALAGGGAATPEYKDDNGKSYSYSGSTFSSFEKTTGATDTVYIGTNVEYAPYHEMGTSRGITGIHFLRRACTEHTDEYRDLMKNSLENA